MAAMKRELQDDYDKRLKEIDGKIDTLRQDCTNESAQVRATVKGMEGRVDDLSKSVQTDMGALQTALATMCAQMQEQGQKITTGFAAINTGMDELRRSGHKRAAEDSAQPS